MVSLEEAGIQPLIFLRSSVFYKQGCPTPSFIPIPSCHPPLHTSLDSLPFSRIFFQVFPHPWDITGLLQLHGNCWWGWTFTLVLHSLWRLQARGLWRGMDRAELPNGMLFTACTGKTRPRLTFLLAWRFLQPSQPAGPASRLQPRKGKPRGTSIDPASQPAD